LQQFAQSCQCFAIVFTAGHGHRKGHFEEVPSGQELNYHCENLVNYEEMKGASFCIIEKCGIDTAHLLLGKMPQLVRFQSVQ
jgi:hypothetical protein